MINFSAFKNYQHMILKFRYSNYLYHLRVGLLITVACCISISSLPVPLQASNQVDPIIYDSALVHYENRWPRGLPKSQAYIHTGLYLGWIIDNNLYSQEFAHQYADEISLFKSREMTGPEIYQVVGGDFSSDLLNITGNRFTADYYSLETGAYMDDYQNLISHTDASVYDVMDTWENYFQISNYIDRQYTLWLDSIN